MAEQRERQIKHNRQAARKHLAMMTPKKPRPESLEDKLRLERGLQMDREMRDAWAKQYPDKDYDLYGGCGATHSQTVLWGKWVHKFIIGFLEREYQKKNPHVKVKVGVVKGRYEIVETS